MANSNGEPRLSVTERIQEIRSIVKEHWDNIFGARAAGVDPHLYAERFFQGLGRNLELLDCTNASLTIALANSAIAGLPINTVDGDGYLVPRNRSVKVNGNWTKIKECHFTSGYLGKLKLAYQHPMCGGVTCDVAKEGDHYEAHLGTRQEIIHQPGKARGPITNFYFIYFFVSGARRCVSWTAEEVQDHKSKFAQGFDNDKSAWASNFSGMGMKTVCRVGLKFAPMPDHARSLLQTEEYLEAGQEVEPQLLKSGDTQPSDDLDALACDPEDRRFTEENATLAGNHAKAADGNGFPADPQTVLPEERKLRQETLLS